MCNILLITLRNTHYNVLCPQKNEKQVVNTLLWRLCYYKLSEFLAINIKSLKLFSALLPHKSNSTSLRK